MARKKSIWIFPDGDVWVVKRERTGRASAIRNTQKEAYEAARNIALNQNLNITVCGPDKKIQRVVTPREARENKCFITTACVKYYGLSDDCYQLRTLRKFRDNYLIETSDNKKLVETYYRIAPRLVVLLEANSNREELFDGIFKKINHACVAIEKRKFEQAKKIYCDSVLDLLNKLNNVV